MRKRLIFVAVTAVGVSTLSGCASKPLPGGAGSDAPTVADSGGSVPASESGSPSATSSVSASVPPTATTPAGVVACDTGDLAVTVLRGSGASQTQFATVRFTNRAATPCTLSGFPGVSLRRAGAELGAPAERSEKAASTVTLAPGAVAFAAVIDHSSCQAPTSDSVRVYPPNSTTSIDLPLTLRGCRLTVDPVTPA